MSLLLVVLALLLVLGALRRELRLDGLGHRPPPRSHPTD